MKEVFYNTGNHPTYSPPSYFAWSAKLFSVMRKKTDIFDPHHIFPNILRRHEIIYDKVRIVGKFFYPNYGARIGPWGVPLENISKSWTFQYGPNPGGDLEIWDFCFGGVCTL